MSTLAAATIITAGLISAPAHSAPPAPGPAGMALAGKTIFLDPGHQGTGHTQSLSRQVDDGRGGKKDCQTTGMTSRGGVPEHTINWKVSQLVKEALQSLGARVVLSRQDDTGWGGCVDDRAKAANASGAAVAISIHSDGGTPQGHGFHLIIPQLPVPNATASKVQSADGLAASRTMRDAYKAAGFVPSSYLKTVDGLQTRTDIAGPALTTVPNVFIEMGNGANPDDAKLLEGLDGQRKHALAITTGLAAFLLRRPVSTTAPAANATAAGTAVAPTTTPGALSPDTSGAATTTSGATVTPSAAVTTRAVPTTTPGTAPSGEGLSSAAIALLQPLLQSLGIDIGTTKSPLLDVLSDLASVLLAPK